MTLPSYSEEEIPSLTMEKMLVCLSNDVEGTTIDNSKNNPQSMMYESGCVIPFPCLSEEIVYHLPGLPSHVEPQLP